MWDYCVDDPVRQKDPSGLNPALIPLLFLAGKLGGGAIAAGGLALGAHGSDKAKEIFTGQPKSDETREKVLEAMKTVSGPTLATMYASSLPLFGFGIPLKVFLSTLMKETPAE